ncbi:MAG: hypothetical protein Q9212_000402 [Teloschistes hypoglaucus]
MVTTRGRTRAPQGAEGEEEAAAATTRQRSRSASPPRTPPPYRQRASAPPSEPQETQSGSDGGQPSPSPPPRRVSQPDRPQPNPPTPPLAYYRDALAELARRRRGGGGGIPAAARPILRPATRIPRAVPLEDPFVNTPGRPRPAIEGFDLRPPPPLIQAPRRRARRRSTETPTNRYVQRRDSRRAARQIRDGVRQETPDSVEEDWGSDRTTGSTETDHARPGFESLSLDVGILETDPERVLPTIEEGRDPILALQAQRASFQLDERRLRHELGRRDDEIADLQRQLNDERICTRRHQGNHQRLAEEHNDLKTRLRIVDRLDARHAQNQAAILRENIAEDRRAHVEEERPRIHDEMRNESPEGLLGDNNTADLRPWRQAPQDRPQLVENQAQEIRRLDEARQRAVDELLTERALREAQADEIRELNARIQHLEGSVAEQNEQNEQNTAQGNGRTASVANDIPPQTTNSQQALNGPPTAAAAQQVNAPTQQPQGQRPARRGRRQAPAAAPPVRTLPARACKNNVKSYKDPGGR